MVRPVNEREAWAQERGEIPEQIAALQRDLDATPIEPHTPAGPAHLDDPAG
jgi:hypothetical protein